jgi:hypothetical protein
VLVLVTMEPGAVTEVVLVMVEVWTVVDVGELDAPAPPAPDSGPFELGDVEDPPAAGALEASPDGEEYDAGAEDAGPAGPFADARELSLAGDAEEPPADGAAEL